MAKQFKPVLFFSQVSILLFPLMSAPPAYKGAGQDRHSVLKFLQSEEYLSISIQYNAAERLLS